MDQIGMKQSNSIDILKARKFFKKFLSKYENQNQPGFLLKVIHSKQVSYYAKKLAKKLNLSYEDIKLAELIGLLHDIGRFEEINFFKQFDSVRFDHASYGVKMLFQKSLIRNFIVDDSYDEIIKTAILNHSRIDIPKNLDKRILIHTKILRDSDKLDNFRVKRCEEIPLIFPGLVRKREDIENSLLSNEVYESVKNQKCVDIKDRKTPLDYWVCVLAFVFDLNFKQSYEMIQKNQDIDYLIERFQYKNKEVKVKMQEIKRILNFYIEDKISK